jgi:HD-GYP domain-containing protein (c-di-GMP phosphodiesterase class II)
MIHDIGKIGIPDAILQKPGPLNLEEMVLMQSHPEVGERICRPLGSAAPLLPIVRHHHEAFDGSGYPDRLRGQEIPLAARIVAVCDGFDALTSTRPYRPARSAREASEILRADRGRQWDPDLVAVLLDDLESALQHEAV